MNIPKTMNDKDALAVLDAWIEEMRIPIQVAQNIRSDLGLPPEDSETELDQVRAYIANHFERAGKLAEAANNAITCGTYEMYDAFDKLRQALHAYRNPTP